MRKITIFLMLIVSFLYSGCSAKVAASGSIGRGGLEAAPASGFSQCMAHNPNGRCVAW